MIKKLKKFCLETGIDNMLFEVDKHTKKKRSRFRKPPRSETLEGRTPDEFHG